MENIINLVTSSLVLETIFKLFVIFILAGIIGLERSTWSKPAGFRTHVLLGISAVLVVLIGDFINQKSGADPTRIPAQLLSGIGFLGAGTILRDGFSVKGLTTAASLLSVTCIGMAIGAGFYIGGIFATVLVFFVLAYFKSFSEKFEHHNNIKIQIKLKNIKDNLKDIRDVLDLYNLEPDEIKTISEDIIEIEGLFKEEFNKNKAFYKLMQIPDVEQVVQIKSYEEE